MSLKPMALLRTLRQDVVLRGGLVSAAVTLIALLSLAAIFWTLLLERLERRAQESLVDRHTISANNAIEFTDEERALFRRFRRSLPIRDEGVFAWINAAGETYSGNVSGLECRDDFYYGWLDVNAETDSGFLPRIDNSAANHSVHDRFLFLAKPRGEDCLVFGRSLYEVDATRESVTGLLVFLIPLCLVPAGCVGLFQSWRLRKRLRQLGKVVQAVSNGDLDARIPTRKNAEFDDDIDLLARQSNRSFDRLQESIGTLQQLTSVIAHDLRAPLSRVAVPLEEAMTAASDGKPDMKSLEEVKEGLADVRSVFDALLRISQIESGRRRAKFVEVDLFDLAESLFEIYQAVVEDSGRALELEVLGAGTSTIQGDAELIQQAMVNLVENATRYTPVGSLIRIGVLRDSAKPALVVSDDGPGLPEEERPRVLRRLYRFEQSTGGQSGHGLGLSLVKAVVELHEAEIFLEDAEPGLLVRIEFDSIA